MTWLMLVKLAILHLARAGAVNDLVNVNKVSHSPSGTGGSSE